MANSILTLTPHSHPSRPERSDKTAREMFLEQAAAYFDDLKITTENVTRMATIGAIRYCRLWKDYWKNAK